MSKQHKYLTPGPTKAVQHQHQLDRLARLFRRIGNTAQDRYLFDLMQRYRRSETV